MANEMITRQGVVAVVPERSAEMIAVEINVEKRNTALTVMQAYIKIGGLLCEVKEQIPHGEFGQWLEDNVQYSVSTANNMMRVYREWAEYQQLDMFNSESFEELFQGMSPTHVLALLPVPRAERAAFIEETGAKDASVREIQEAVKAREEAEKRAKAAEEREQAAAGRADAAEAEKQALAGKLEETEVQLKLMKAVGTTPEERARIEREAAEKAKADADKKIEQAKKKAEKDLEKARAEGAEQVKKVEAERDAAIERAREEAKAAAERESAAKIAALEDKLKRQVVAASPHMERFKAHLEAFQEAYRRMLAVVSDAEGEAPDIAAQLRRVMGELVKRLVASGEGENGASGTPQNGASRTSPPTGEGAV